MNRPRVPVIALTIALAIAPLACALGPAEEPGCRVDAECDVGFSCRAGACFRVTTPRSPPRDPGDAGVDGG